VRVGAVTGPQSQSKLVDEPLDGEALLRAPVRATLPPLTSSLAPEEPAGLAMLLPEHSPPRRAEAPLLPSPDRQLRHIRTPPVPRKGHSGHTVAMGHRQSSKPMPPTAVRSLLRCWYLKTTQLVWLRRGRSGVGV
jgi:hypothetical protein